MSEINQEDYEEKLKIIIEIKNQIEQYESKKGSNNFKEKDEYINLIISLGYLLSEIPKYYQQSNTYHDWGIVIPNGRFLR